MSKNDKEDVIKEIEGYQFLFPFGGTEKQAKSFLFSWPMDYKLDSVSKTLTNVYIKNIMDLIVNDLIVYRFSF